MSDNEIARIFMRDSTSTAATGKLRAGEEYDVPLGVALHLIKLGIAGRAPGTVAPPPPGHFVASDDPALSEARRQTLYVPAPLAPYVPPPPAPRLRTLTDIHWPAVQSSRPQAKPARAPHRHAHAADVRYTNAWEPFGDAAGDEWSVEGYLTRTGALSRRMEAAP